MSLIETIKLGKKKLFIHFHDAADPDFKKNHPQAPGGAPEGKGGQFVKKGSAVGGSTPTKTEKQPEAKSETKSEHHPDLVEVGGDEWNKKTAKRLADEYRDAKPALDAVKDKLISSGPLSEKEDEDESVVRMLVAQKWSKISDTTKKEVETDWMESHWEEMHKENVESMKEYPDISKDRMEELTLKSLRMVWSNMAGNEKYDYASTHHPEIIKLAEQDRKKNLGEPAHYDPLNEPIDDLSDEEYQTAINNYRKTQGLARKMSVDRSYDLILQRKAKDIEGWGERSLADLRDDITRIDGRLWSSWKGSSTSQDGALIQVASADELGGRMRSTNIDEWKDYANLNYPEVGGYDGIKAMMRAKWETSQYLLEKAGINKVEVYRGLDLSEADDQPRQRIETNYTGPVKSRGEVDTELDYALLPDVDIKRNGAASTSLSYDISNGWDGDDHRVVLRISAPRTAVLSLPAYGVNETSEREVVLAGTAWTAWDAWSGRSAPIEAVPIGQAHGEEMELPVHTQLKKALEDKGFEIYTDKDDKTGKLTVEGDYIKQYEDDKLYMSFKYYPDTKTGTLTVQPDLHEDAFEEIKTEGGPEQIIQAANLAFATKHPMVKLAVDKLKNTGYELDSNQHGSGGSSFWFTDYEGKMVSITTKLTPEGSPMVGAAAWIAFDKDGFALEKGDNMKDLPKYLSREAHKKAA